MPLEESILKSTKKILGLDADYNAFDLDVITHINTCFASLHRLGIGPVNGFMIEDSEATWDDFTEGDMLRNSVKTYIYLKVRSLFDAPGTPHHLTALKEQIAELEYTLLTEKNISKWPTQSSLPSLP